MLAYHTSRHRQIEQAIRELPTPRILRQLLALLHSEDAQVSDVALIVKRDPGLVGVLLNAANSAAFCGFEPVTTVDGAVARLGFRETCRIVGNVASGHLANRALHLYGIRPQRLWENSLFCACAMEELAAACDLNAGTAYTIGLLRSLGKAVLDGIGGISEPLPAEGMPLIAWEEANWAVTSAEVTGWAFEAWGVSRVAVNAVRAHLHIGPLATPSARLLNVAAALADTHGFGLPGETPYWDAGSPQVLGLADGQLAYAAQCALEMVAGAVPTGSIAR